MYDATEDAKGVGASAEAIRAHYDIGNDFYRLWLDETMTYSCAMWRPGDDLRHAQIRKLDFHAIEAQVDEAERVLDVGCGWGSLVERLSAVHGVPHVVGLTLSDAQATEIAEKDAFNLDIRVESWREHENLVRYDSIISVGALEHFVAPELGGDERIRVYREFFERCHGWLREGGRISLQTITYGRGGFRDGAIASIFPESDLPRLYEVAAGFDGLFEVVGLRNDRRDYARTCRAWLARLARNEGRAIETVGERTTKHYMRFLDAAARGFDASVFNLFRISLRRLCD